MISGTLVGQLLSAIAKGPAFPLPPYFPAQPDFKIFGSGLGGYSTDYNPASDKPVTPNRYYVTKGGAGAKDGSSVANAFDSVQNALNAAEAAGSGEIIIDCEGGAPVFRTAANEAFTNFTVNNEDISIIGINGRPILAAALDLSGGWFDTGAPGEVYQKSITSGSYDNVVDLTWLDEYGAPRKLMQVYNLADTYANPGSYYDYAPNTTFIHLFDGRTPDVEELLFMNGDSFFTTTTRHNTVYLENLDIFGRRAYWSYGSDATRTCKSVLVDCRFGYNAVDEACVRCEKTQSRIIRCSTHYTHADGFGYNGTFDFSITPYLALEVDCFGFMAGNLPSGDTNNNTTSAHYNIAIIRLNCVGDTSQGPVCSDVLGAHALMLGCEFRNSDSSGASVNSCYTVGSFYNGNIATAYLKDCKLHGSNYDWRRSGGGMLIDLGGNDLSGTSQPDNYVDGTDPYYLTLATVAPEALSSWYDVGDPSYFRNQNGGVDDLYDLGPEKRFPDAPTENRAVVITETNGVQILDFGDVPHDIYYISTGAEDYKEAIFVFKYKDGLDNSFDADAFFLSDTGGNNYIKGLAGTDGLDTAAGAFSSAGGQVLPSDYNILRVQGDVVVNMTLRLFGDGAGGGVPMKLLTAIFFRQDLSIDQFNAISAAIQNKINS